MREHYVRGEWSDWFHGFSDVQTIWLKMNTLPSAFFRYKCYPEWFCAAHQSRGIFMRNTQRLCGSSNTWRSSPSPDANDGECNYLPFVCEVLQKAVLIRKWIGRCPCFKLNHKALWPSVLWTQQNSKWTACSDFFIIFLELGLCARNKTLRMMLLWEKSFSFNCSQALMLETPTRKHHLEMICCYRNNNEGNNMKLRDTGGL